MNGKKITTLASLIRAADCRKAVVVRNTRQSSRMPAAFVASMQCRYVYGMMRQGMWIYRKGGKWKRKSAEKRM